MATTSKEKLAVGAALAAAIVALVLMTVPTVGGPVVGDKLELTKDATTMTLDVYGALVQLVTLLFGAVAFLVTYQLRKGATPRPSSWAVLAAAVVFLLGALAQGFLGRELLLRMIGSNLINLDAAPLRNGRLALYVFVLLGAAGIGWFALDITLAATPVGPTMEDK